jgi:hypothetical protein
MELAALGLKLKHKKNGSYIQQPCPQYQYGECAIYAIRPQRCRLFECRQLKRVAAGEITEAKALEKITDVHRRVARINELLQASGTTDPKRPLAKRCEKIMAEPLDPSADEATATLRSDLARAIDELDAILDRDFRPPRPAVVES